MTRRRGVAAGAACQGADDDGGDQRGSRMLDDIEPHVRRLTVDIAQAGRVTRLRI
jgi:hypothetical protein